MTPLPTGFRSSEFWLALAGVAALVALVLHGDLPGTWAAPAIAAACFGYTASRTVVKATAVSGTAQVASFKSDLASLAPATTTLNVIGSPLDLGTTLQAPTTDGPPATVFDPTAD